MAKKYRKCFSRRRNVNGLSEEEKREMEARAKAIRDYSEEIVAEQEEELADIERRTRRRDPSIVGQTFGG